MEPAKNQPSQETSLHFLDYWRIIRIRKTIIITVFLITSVIATVVTFLLPASYASMTRIKIENDSASDVQNMGNMSMVTPYDPYFIQTEFQIMQSQQVLGRVISKLDLNDVWGKAYNNNVPFTTDETMLLLKQRMDLSPERNTKLIDITVYSGDKNEAAKLANAIAEAYREYRFSLHTELATNGIGVLEQSFEADQDKIRFAQSNVDFLRSNLKIVDFDPNSTAPSPTLSEADVQKYNENMIEDEQTYTKHEKQLAGLEGYDKEKLRDILPGIVTDPELSDSLSNLHLSEQKYVQMTNTLGLANPDVITLQSLIGELNSEIDRRVDGIMDGLKGQLASDKAALDELKDQVESAKKKDQEEAQRGQPYWEAKRDLESDVQFHALLQAKIASDQLDLQIPKTSMVEIIDQAKPGKDPVRPNKTLNIILGIIIGLAVGIGLAFFIEYLDTSVKTIDDVERAFQSPVLGVIPQNVGYLVDDKDGENRHAEAYRVLRTNLLFSRKDEKFNTIVIVSAGAGEGKSTTTLNLATIFAQNGQRVLVVDSDLRRPTLHKLLHVANNLGLTNYLLKQNTIEEIVQTTPVPTLHFMASGKLPSGSMGILGSTQMREMISELKKRYDYIFFDSPPILGVSDASILASEVDMVMQVIQYRRYPQPMNLRAKQLIEKIGGNYAGIVLNNINMSQDESYYYYSGYYHDYYYSRSEDSQAAAAKDSNAPGDTGRTGIKQKY
ncbi:MAG TPA: polysaccharide biosynthesis tyrosine autokinase [Verrucomicrobiae bacterium]